MLTCLWTPFKPVSISLFKKVRSIMQLVIKNLLLDHIFASGTVYIFLLIKVVVLSSVPDLSLCVFFFFKKKGAAYSNNMASQ